MVSTMKELIGYNKLITIGKINENIDRIVMDQITEIIVKKLEGLLSKECNVKK